MTDERLDAAISIRMPTRMKTMIDDRAARMGIKPSAYAFRLLKYALEVEENATTSSQVANNVNIADNTSSSALIASLQSRIAGLEEQLEAMQNIVNEARSIREEAVQQAIDDCLQTVDTRIQTRIQEVVNKEMSELMGGAIA